VGDNILRNTTKEVAAGDPFAHAGERAYACAGCNRRLPKQDLITVHEGHHDNLHFFHGDRICKPCARRNGVEF
jgi:hypothetical protein